MCRVILRPQAREQRGVAPSAVAGNFADLLTGFDPASLLEAKQEPLSPDSELLETAEGFELQDTDADLLAMFQELAEEPAPELAPLAMPTSPAASLPGPMVPFEPVQTLPVPARPAMTIFDQQLMFQQAMLQQQQAAMATAQIPVKPGYPTLRRGKTPEEVAAQVERTKQRRRESAHRSRSRRKDYMKTLEEENDALRAENAALRAKLKVQGVSLTSSVMDAASRQTSGGADSGSSSEVAAMQM
ncbi:hypothetical protein F751_3784 [Auxenochlorella protothecoides]|uniref:BZIP domain-containing protein n=1 Tax=Auxenochlorella protothecoides TaxID=3075 RepID=A0A087SGB8_AUXPR|nr:hypothetical protein F751_3784 [Auxenochlorella protothecoides]KFM24772.1 hypothetical protein F751_3784 [Auxenochlorella protothecoides]